jgi:hypothetical protein
MSTLLEPTQSARASQEKSLAASSRWSILIAITVLILWAALRVTHPIPIYPLDDPYIALHSAQVLHWGADPNYQGVPALYGATSAPFLLLVYFLLFALQPVYALDVACWLGVLAYVLGLRYLVHTFRLPALESTLLFVLGLVASYEPLQLINGLETTWVMAAIAWSLFFASGPPSHRKWAALAAGCTASLRPELILFALPFIAALAILEGTSRKAAVLFAYGLLPVVPVALWYLYATGSPIPQTATAKRYFMAQDRQSIHDRIAMSTVAMLRFAITCGPLLLAVPLAIRSWTGRVIAAFTILLVASACVIAPGSLSWNNLRYLMVLVPMLVWCLGSVSTCRPNVRSWKKYPLLRISALWSLLWLPLMIRGYLHECAYFDTELRSSAIWCTDHLPPDSVLMVHDAGYIAYATKFKIVDVVGLKTPDAIPINKRLIWATRGGGRGAAAAEIAVLHHAGYLVVLRSWTEMAALPAQMRAIGWAVTPMRSGGAYEVFRITAPHGRP